MKVADAILATSRSLRECGVDEARLLAEHLLADMLAVERLALSLRHDQELNESQSLRLEVAVERLSRHEPLQYVLGYTEFFGRVFRTDKRALIPRPETEELVARVLRERELWDRGHASILDIGTGTGCIAITLALEQARARISAIDLSTSALQLARENADLHQVDSINWLQGDILQIDIEQGLDAIVSNPPYIASAEIDRLDRNVRDYEPRLALDGGADGLDFIRPIAAGAARSLRPGGWIFLEIGEDQGPALEDVLRASGFRTIEISRDLAGHQRIATARI
jgi:release factor glutamine methyltransferase